MAKKISLSKDERYYQPEISREVFSDREAKAEYNRLRRVANQRIDRLERGGYGESKVMKRYGLGFESSKGLSPEEIRQELGQVAHFLNLKTSTVGGQRHQLKAFVQTMQEKGYDWINMQNGDAVRRFFEAAKDHWGEKSKAYSGTVLDDLEKIADKPAEIEKARRNFDEWAEKMGYEEQIGEPTETGPTPVREKKQRKTGQLSDTQRERRARKARSERRARASQKRGTAKRR